MEHGVMMRGIFFDLTAVEIRDRSSDRSFMKEDAKHLFIFQPGLSNAIKDLEEESP